MEPQKINTLDSLDFQNPEVKYLSDVYDILVKNAKAYNEPDSNFEKYGFIASHLTSNQYPCQEWRFCGSLGFGGKYRIGSNSVDCYKENFNATTKRIIAKTNAALATLEIPESFKRKSYSI